MTEAPKRRRASRQVFHSSAGIPGQSFGECVIDVHEIGFGLMANGQIIILSRWMVEKGVDGELSFAKN
jgi:hypothetical protein